MEKETQIFKIEDALCLGHDAMRKTKVDMAKRLYSRARRGRLNGAMLKWKAETQNDRTMEEHANAVEAMSNWAARIAGGRILKERFQIWMAFAQKNILQRNYKLAVLNAVTLRFVKSTLCVAFQIWKQDMYEFAIDSSRNTMLETHLAKQDDYDKQIQDLLKSNRKVSLKNILLRLVKADLTRGFYKWKHLSNRSKIKEVHDLSLQKQKKLESDYSDQVASLTSEQNAKMKELERHNENKVRDMKNLHMEHLESIETKHASFIRDMEADWSSKLEEQENDHRNAVENAQNHRLEIEEKYSATLSKLKSRHTKYWTNLSKSQVLRTWREGALMLRLQRYREKSTSHIFKRYNRLRRKHSFAKWHVYTRNRIHKRAILGHIFGNSMRRKIFVFFHFWRRCHQQDYYRSVNDYKQLSMAISSWRQLENKRIRKMFYNWRAYVSHSIKKHQTIIWLFKWKRHHTLLRGWRKLKDSTSQLSYFINIKRKHELIASTKESWDKLARKRNFFFKWKENYLNQKHLQFENGVNLRLLDVEKKIRNRTLTHFFGVRLRLLRRTSLSQSMARWAYFASNRKHQRLRVINLMKTSRISIYRRAIRQWKTFVHNDRLFSYENMSHDRIVSSRIRTMERSCLRKSFHRWHVSFYNIQQSRKMLGQILRKLSHFHTRAAFSWWKYFATRLKTDETKRLQQNRLLQNLASSKNYRMMNKMLNRWIIYIKWILKRNAALRSMLVRKSISQTRAALKIWHKKYTNDSIRCRCIVRLSLSLYQNNDTYLP